MYRRVCVRVTNWRRTRSSFVRCRRRRRILRTRLLHGTYHGYAQVISYSEGVRLSSRLGRVISDVWTRSCMFMRPRARVCVFGLRMCTYYVYTGILGHGLKDYASELIIGQREFTSADTSFAPLRR